MSETEEQEEEIKYHKVTEEEFSGFLTSQMLRTSKYERKVKYLHTALCSTITIGITMVALLAFPEAAAMIVVPAAVIIPSFFIYVLDNTMDWLTGLVNSKFALFLLKIHIEKKKEKDKEDGNNRSNNTASNSDSS